MHTDRADKLSIALINANELGGGAESFACALHSGYLHSGHHSTLWVGRIRGQSPPTQTYAIPATPNERRTALRHAWRGFYGIGVESSHRFCRTTALENVDVVHLHNAHGHYLSLDAIPVLARRAPLVWTLHDFYAFTGGCAFPLGCQKWRSKCGPCPEIGRYPLSGGYDRTRRLQAIKKKCFATLSGTIICPARHLANAVADSGVFRRADIEVIPYGVDTTLFARNRRSARHRLGLPLSGPVLLLTANWLDDPRKGLHFSLDVLRRLQVPGLIVLVAGRGDDQAIVNAAPHLDVRTMGYVTSRETMAELYAAANLMISTSLSEVFPISIQESMACGTAVLAFDIDGVREQIEPHETGFLIPVRDSSKLAAVANELLHHRERLEAVGQTARRHAVRHWAMDKCIDRHLDLYHSVVARRSGVLVT